MFRRKRLWVYLLMGFGLGLLIGMWIEGGFLAHCIGLGLLFFGLSQLCRKQV